MPAPHLSLDLDTPKPARLVSARQVKIRLGVGDCTMLTWVATGRLKPIIEPGRTPRYRADDIERLAAELNATAGSPVGK